MVAIIIFKYCYGKSITATVIYWCDLLCIASWASYIFGLIVFHGNYEFL